MGDFFAAFMDSFQGSNTDIGADGAMNDTVSAIGEISPPPTAMTNLGNTIGGLGNQAMAPTMQVYKTFTNPNSTANDMLSSAYKYAFNPKTKEEDQTMYAPQMRMGSGMGGMANNYVGGIPSLLQGYGTASQGILPYIAGR